MLDADTGKLKRFWGATATSDDTPLPASTGRASRQQFATPCTAQIFGGSILTFDRVGDRSRFYAGGKFVKEAFFAKNQERGSVWDMRFERRAEKYIFMARCERESKVVDVRPCRS